MTFTRSSRTLILLSLLGWSHCRAMKENKSDAIHRENGCRATFTEGQTAELKFFIGHEALAHDDFFAHLRRSDDTDIVICDRKSPVNCTALDPRYKTKPIANDSFVLLIPNVTMEFEDIYVFQAYANSKPEPRNECPLKVKERTGETRTGKCTAPIVTAGNIGEVRFVIGDGLLSQGDFLVRIRRVSDPVSDIIVCDQNTSLQCKLLNPRYESDGIKVDTLTLRIPNISLDFEDMYILQVHVSGPPQFPVGCHLTVNGHNAHNADINGGSNSTWIIITVVVIVLSVVVVSTIYIVPKMKKKCKKRRERSTGKTGTPLFSDTNKAKMLTSEKTENTRTILAEDGGNDDNVPRGKRSLRYTDLHQPPKTAVRNPQPNNTTKNPPKRKNPKRRDGNVRDVAHSCSDNHDVKEPNDGYRNAPSEQEPDSAVYCNMLRDVQAAHSDNGDNGHYYSQPKD